MASRFKLLGPITPSRRNAAPRRRPLRLETLEGREVPATLAPITDFTTPDTKALYVPLTASNATGTVTYSAGSSDPLVQIDVVTGGTTVVMNVSGTDANGNAFSGDLTFRLFDSLSPTTSARIKALVQQGFYNGLTIHRVVPGFVIQGGDPNGNGTGGSGVTLDDEYSPVLTFNSPGLLAMANSGDDTGDSQFFVTVLDHDPSFSLQNLNFNHTIFGQLVAGFDTYNKIIGTPLRVQNGQTTQSPQNTVRINTASVVANDPNGVLRVTAPDGYTGTTSISVTPTDGGADSTGATFNVTFQPDAINDLPFLGPVAPRSTPAGVPVSFTLTATDLEDDDLTYKVFSAVDSSGNAVALNPQVSGATITLTPPATFTGAVRVKVGVRDQTAHARDEFGNLLPVDNVANYDTQTFTLTVTPRPNQPPALAAVAGQSVPRDTPAAFTLSGTDPENDALTYKLVAATDADGNAVAVTSAVDQANRRVTVTPPAGFSGPITLTFGVRDQTARATDGNGNALPLNDDANFVTRTATLTVSATPNVPPTLAAVAGQATPVGTGVTFSLAAADTESDALTYKLLSAVGSGGAAVAVTSQVNQATGVVTVTPPAGFAGPITLTFGVRDGTARAKDSNGNLLALDNNANYTTQSATLTVTGAVDLDAASDTGPLSDDDLTAAPTPTFTIVAPAGQTVTVSLNGTAVGTATPTANAGTYTFTLPVGRLLVGANTVAATATGSQNAATALTGLTVTFAPSLQSTYTAPGAAGTTQSLAVDFLYRESDYRSEFGYFVADDAAGTVDGNAPGSAGYAAAALARRQVIFDPSAAAGTTSAVTVDSGGVLVFYIVQNSTSAVFLATNPSNAANAGRPVAFFSVAAANPDGIAHVSVVDDPAASQAIYSWEDLTGGGDRDFNDMVVAVRLAANPLSAALLVQAAAGREVTATATLETATKASTSANPGTSTTANGEVGFFLVDAADGTINGLKPGDAGYAAAALARARVLFARGVAAGTRTNLRVTGGQYFGIYYVPNGTAAAAAASGGPTAFFSFDAANPGGVNHVRTFGAEQVSQPAPSAGDPYRFHLMGTVNGGADSFDDVVFTVQFGA